MWWVCVFLLFSLCEQKKKKKNEHSYIFTRCMWTMLAYSLVSLMLSNTFQLEFSWHLLHIHTFITFAQHSIGTHTHMYFVSRWNSQMIEKWFLVNIHFYTLCPHNNMQCIYLDMWTLYTDLHTCFGHNIVYSIECKTKHCMYSIRIINIARKCTESESQKRKFRKYDEPEMEKWVKRKSIEWVYLYKWVLYRVVMSIA